MADAMHDAAPQRGRRKHLILIVCAIAAVVLITVSVAILSTLGRRAALADRQLIRFTLMPDDEAVGRAGLAVNIIEFH